MLAKVEVVEENVEGETRVASSSVVVVVGASRKKAAQAGVSGGTSKVGWAAVEVVLTCSK